MGVSFMLFGLLLVQMGAQQQPQKQQPAKQEQQAQQDQRQQPERNGIILRLEEEIKGKEQMPAEQVWKNIQLFKGEPAIKVLNVMEYAFITGLGVKCNYCHEPGKWELDAKDHKVITRQMWAMQANVSKEIKAITGEDDATVNCTTCHRGDTKPALSLVPRVRRDRGDNPPGNR